MIYQTVGLDKKILQKTVFFSAVFFGAGGGGRTRTSLRTRDFEARASANSTTPAFVTQPRLYHTVRKKSISFLKKIKNVKKSEKYIVIS